ncbi:MAG: SPOR domain-containing protein [Gemmatimonadota bacterium]|nr:SPOR domain-containing protein [Gemmatimonadota bacterium]
MSQKVSGGRPVAWEDAGRQVAPVLGSYSAIVVVSSDPLAAAYVALGIALVEAGHRRSVVGDLVGDLPPLRSLVREEDPHGITDSFLYGVSLNKIGYDVEGVPNLYVMPSGTDPSIDAEIIGSQRWAKLATGFAEAGAFLALVAKSDAPGLADLVDQLDGVVLVKDAELLNAPSALVLARIAGPTPTLKLPLHRISAGAARWPHHRWLYPGLVALGVLVLGGMGLALILGRAGQSPRPAQSVVAVKSIAPPLPPPPRAAPETLTIVPPANPGDSLSASVFSVELLVANTAEGANLFVRKNGAALPAATVSPVPIGPERATWYRVMAGAYTTRDQADSLLRALRESRLVADDSVDHVKQTPLALLVDSVSSQGGIGDAIRAAVQKYAARGLPVYTLMQNDGGARIFAGAFATASQSAELTKTLRAAGVKPVLVYRTGSTP